MTFSASSLSLPLSAFSASVSPQTTDGKATKMNNIIRIAICLFIIGSIPNCLAREWRGSVSTEVEVPSYLSIDQAELIGVQKLKEIASLKAGTYVRVSESLINGNYQRRVHSINASYVSISNVDKSVVLNDGTVLLALKAEASVDMSVVDERIDNDQSRTERLDIAPGGEIDFSVPLNNAKFELNTKELALSRGEVGYLSRSHRHSESLGRKLAMDVINHLMYDAKIDSEVISTESSSDEVSALVKVYYNFNEKKLASLLPSSIRFQYRDQREHPVFVIFRPTPSDKEAVAFYEFLSGHPLGVDLTTSSSTATIPVLYHGDDHFSGCRVRSVDGRDSDVLCIQKILDSDGALNTRSLKNTVAISQIKQSLGMEGEAFRIKVQVSMVAR